MLKEKSKLILLIIIVILTFVFGVRYELDYRILTRQTIHYLADYKLGFYGGKDFRIFETDIAFILTLLPIGLYFTARKINSVKRIIVLNVAYLILIPIYYVLFCYLESQFIKITVTDPLLQDGVLKYHQNNVNYRIILFFTILFTFISGKLIKKITAASSLINRTSKTTTQN
jgi:hypothetical protein